MLIFSTDKNRLYRHFQKDPVLFSYHIGDLDDFYFNDCQWAVDYKERAHINEVILIYTGCKIPTVLAFGVSDRFQSLLEETIDLLPPKFYCHFQPDSHSIFPVAYNETSLGTHQKMKLVKFNDNISVNENNHIMRLDMSHKEQLQKLYDASYPDNYFTERMLETGKYFGYMEDDKIVSVSGVHVDSNEYKIAVLGNVVTSLKYRNRGLATLVTARLVKELVDEEKTVCLNVKCDNIPAIKSYEKLGFEKVHEYEEALFELKL
ncbi:MAG: GNAT family N-acetyltransferase [Candidatus Zixiibacteriota bacterium]